MAGLLDCHDTLAALATLGRDISSRWWIIGSAAAALHGAETDVRDVDLLAAPEAAAQWFELLNLPALPGVPDERFRSAIFGRSSALPLPVEVMSGLELRGNQGWKQVMPHTRQAITVELASVYVPVRRELIALFRQFGRSKDLLRAELLESLG